MEAVCYQLWLVNQLDFYHSNFLACLASMELPKWKHTDVRGEHLGTLQAALLTLSNLDLQREKTKRLTKHPLLLYFFLYFFVKQLWKASANAEKAVPALPPPSSGAFGGCARKTLPAEVWFLLSSLSRSFQRFLLDPPAALCLPQPVCS